MHGGFDQEFSEGFPVVQQDDDSEIIPDGFPQIQFPNRVTPASVADFVFDGICTVDDNLSQGALYVLGELNELDPPVIGKVIPLLVTGALNAMESAPETNPTDGQMRHPVVNFVQQVGSASARYMLRRFM